MRAIWKGAISFGLVSVPVGVFSATRSEEPKFRLLRASDLSPINYKRVVELDGKELPWEQIVNGYEYEKGKFVVLKDEDFKRVDLEATQTIDIMDFVDVSEINPVFFHRPYYLEPQRGGANAHALLRDVLADTVKAGIAKVAIKTREHEMAKTLVDQMTAKWDAERYLARANASAGRGSARRTAPRGLARLRHTLVCHRESDIVGRGDPSPWIASSLRSAQ
ncbi:MAG: hypothetical protein HYV96_01660 [Opitutae bacterium]|nr:hypothetical protein [Opitutae bacterium]